MINRVREVVESSSHAQDKDQLASTNIARRRAVRRKFIAWNASSAAQAEVVEYLEELIDLTKILVGAHEFKSGMLNRDIWSSAEDGAEGKGKGDDGHGGEDGGDVGKRTSGHEIQGMRRRTNTASSRRGQGNAEEEEGVPEMLKRMQSRRLEARVSRDRTKER